MQFIKRYSSLLMPAGLILCAIAFFVVTVLMSRSTRAEMEKSVSAGKHIESLKGKAVSRDQWKIERQYQQEYSKDAEAVKGAAKASCQRELLSYKMFPKPKYVSQQIFEEFGERYRRAIEGLIAKMRGGERSSEIRAGASVSGSSVTRWEAGGALTTMGGFRSSSRGGRSVRSQRDTEKEVWNKLCEAQAEKISVYADASTFKGYDYWGNYNFIGAKTATEDCWKWQSGLWIQEDIADTIAAMNVDSDSVFTSPVKRLLHISFSEMGMVERSSTYGIGGAEPKYITSLDIGLVKPYTKRVCNDDIDVVHFSFSVLLDSDAVMSFLEELCRGKKHKFSGFTGTEPEQDCEHNQITILDFDMKPLDKQKDYKEGYRYGERCVVKLNLVCEYVFDRAGYDVIKPESIKEQLSPTQEQQAGKVTGRGRSGRTSKPSAGDKKSSTGDKSAIGSTRRRLPKLEGFE